MILVKTFLTLSALFVSWMLQAADTTKIPNFRAEVCRSAWTWKTSARAITFQPNGKASITGDAATKYTWKVKSSEKRIVEVEWPYMGIEHSVIFTFAEDMKSAKAVTDGGKPEWVSKPVSK